jgi:uncharacterized cupin superfamily protein
MEEVKIERLTEDEKRKRGIDSWSIWEKEVSKFDWEYFGTEQCLILEGEVIVTTGQGEYHIKAGDFVTFQDGLKCHWNITKAIRKHYNFI